jgi:hypothetical protein
MTSTTPRRVTTRRLTLPQHDLARARLTGAAAIAFAVLVLTENTLFPLTGAPGYDTPLEQVLAYYAGNGWVIATVSGLVALYLPVLLALLTGLHGLIARRGPAGADGSRLALAAGAAVAAIFVLVNVLQIGLVLTASGQAQPSAAFDIVWRAHAAAFSFTLPMLGTAAIGTALAGHASGLTRPWQRVLGITGGILLLAAGVGTVAIAQGSPLIAVGLAGFAAWLLWMLTTGIRLLRARAA